jgi:hypothetical protein
MKINTKFRRPSAAMVVASTALAVAIAGGGAYAATQINGSDLVNKSVKNGKIANQAINNRTLAKGSVLKSTLAPGAITTYLRSETVAVPIGTTGSAFPKCDSGDDVTGGGFGGVPVNAYANSGTSGASVLYSRPATSNGSAPLGNAVPVGWNAALENNTTNRAEFLVYVVCLDA